MGSTTTVIIPITSSYATIQPANMSQGGVTFNEVTHGYSFEVSEVISTSYDYTTLTDSDLHFFEWEISINESDFMPIHEFSQLIDNGTVYLEGVTSKEPLSKVAFYFLSEWGIRKFKIRSKFIDKLTNIVFYSNELSCTSPITHTQQTSFSEVNSVYSTYEVTYNLYFKLLTTDTIDPGTFTLYRKHSYQQVDTSAVITVDSTGTGFSVLKCEIASDVLYNRLYGNPLYSEYLAKLIIAELYVLTDSVTTWELQNRIDFNIKYTLPFSRATVVEIDADSCTVTDSIDYLSGSSIVLSESTINSDISNILIFAESESLYDTAVEITNPSNVPHINTDGWRRRAIPGALGYPYDMPGLNTHVLDMYLPLTDSLMEYFKVTPPSSTMNGIHLYVSNDPNITSFDTANVLAPEWDESSGLFTGTIYNNQADTLDYLQIQVNIKQDINLDIELTEFELKQNDGVPEHSYVYAYTTDSIGTQSAVSLIYEFKYTNVYPGIHYYTAGNNVNQPLTMKLSSPFFDDGTVNGDCSLAYDDQYQSRVRYLITNSQSVSIATSPANLIDDVAGMDYPVFTVKDSINFRLYGGLFTPYTHDWTTDTVPTEVTPTQSAIRIPQGVLTMFVYQEYNDTTSQWDTVKVIKDENYYTEPKQILSLPVLSPDKVARIIVHYFSKLDSIITGDLYNIQGVAGDIAYLDSTFPYNDSPHYLSSTSLHNTEAYGLAVTGENFYVPAAANTYGSKLYPANDTSIDNYVMDCPLFSKGQLVSSIFDTWRILSNEDKTIFTLIMYLNQPDSSIVSMKYTKNNTDYVFDVNDLKHAISGLSLSEIEGTWTLTAVYSNTTESIPYTIDIRLSRLHKMKNADNNDSTTEYVLVPKNDSEYSAVKLHVGPITMIKEIFNQQSVKISDEYTTSEPVKSIKIKVDDFVPEEYFGTDEDWLSYSIIIGANEYQITPTNKDGSFPKILYFNSNISEDIKNEYRLLLQAGYYDIINSEGVMEFPMSFKIKLTIKRPVTGSGNLQMTSPRVFGWKVFVNES